MIIEHLDACAQALRAADLPCTAYQMWLDEANLVHYWFDYARPLTPLEDLRSAAILARYFRED
jgi:hypothetical protein